MSTLCGQSADETLIHPNFSRTLGNAERDLTDPPYRQKEMAFVQLEIQVEALQRLIGQHNLVIEEIHCMNGRSKNIVRQALLDSLIGYGS